jgi:hypothetical protein
MRIHSMARQRRESWASRAREASYLLGGTYFQKEAGFATLFG